jgi:hypothetical protein
MRSMRRDAIDAITAMATAIETSAAPETAASFLDCVFHLRASAAQC